MNQGLRPRGHRRKIVVLLALALSLLPLIVLHLPRQSYPPPQGPLVNDGGPSESSNITGLDLEWVEDPHHYSLRGTNISDLDWNPDYTLLAAATCSEELAIIDPDTWPAYRSINVTNGYVYSISWSPDSNYLAEAGHDGSVVIYRTSDWAVHKTITFDPEYDLVAIDYSPDGRWLAVGRGNEIAIWNTTYWLIDDSQQFDDDLDEILKLAWSPDGSMIYMGGDGMCLVRWDLRVLDLRPFDFIETCWSPDGTYYSPLA